MSDSEKTAYQEKMEAKLEKLQAEIQHLEAELKDSKADSRIGLEERLGQLRQRSEGARDKLHELKHASGSAWSQAKEGFVSAWHDLEAGFKKAHEEFKRR